MTSVRLEGLGAVLARLRRDRGLTGVELADRAGVTPAMVSRYENETVTPRPKTLERLLTALDAGSADVAHARFRLAIEDAGLPAGASPASIPLADELETLLADPACRAALVDLLSALGRFYGTALAALRESTE